MDDKKNTFHSLKILFENTRAESHARYNETYGVIIQQLNTCINQIKEIGVDIELSKMSLYEKTRQGVLEENWPNLQLVLRIYDRQYIIFPLSDNEFFMHNKTINKFYHSHHSAPYPDPLINTENGEKYNFADPDSIDAFMQSIIVTAAECAGQELFLKENNLVKHRALQGLKTKPGKNTTPPPPKAAKP